MIIEKELQTRVELTGNLALSPNIDDVIMDILKQRFQGRCYAASYILDVLEIVRKSDTINSRIKQDASFVVTVMFRVKAMSIKEYDILHNCVVNRIDEKGNFVCKNDYASIYIGAHPALQKIKMGQVVVVLAMKIAYDIFKQEMSIKAFPFIPIINNKLNVIYKLNVKNETPLIDQMLARFQNEVKLLKDHDSRVVSVFHDLLYPYKTQDKLIELKKNATLMSIDNIKFPTNKTIYISMDVAIPRSSYQIAVYNELKTEDPLSSSELQLAYGNPVIEESYDNIISMIIHQYIEYIGDILRLSSTYHSMDLIKKNNVLWDIYRKFRV